MSENIARMILNSIDNDKSQIDRSTPFGSAFSKILEQQDKVINKEEIEADEEISRKVKFLKICETNGDMAWFDFNSWNVLPKEFKEKFVEYYDPLILGGVYFQYSKFRMAEFTFWKMLTADMSIYELADRDSYKFVCISQESNSYDFMGEMKLRDLKKTFNESMIRRIGYSEGKVVIKRGFKDERNQKGSNDSNK